MAFEPGKSGNPAGRPKQADLEAVDLSILRALRKVVRKNPRLIEEAIQRRLESRDNFGMIEMIAKLTKELGTQEEQRSQIAIIFNGGLDTRQLKQVDAKIIECQPNVTGPIQQLEQPSNENGTEIILENTLNTQELIEQNLEKESS